MCTSVCATTCRLEGLEGFVDLDLGADMLTPLTDPKRLTCLRIQTVASVEEEVYSAAGCT